MQVRHAGPRRFLRLFSLVAGVAVLVAIAQTPPGRSLLQQTGLVRQQASYSALYFTDPGGLPGRVPAGHVGVDVSFAVHNETRSRNTYRWTVLLVRGKVTRSVAEGAVTVAGGGTTTERRMVSALCPSGTLKVVVRLAAPAESIDFMAACGG